MAYNNGFPMGYPQLNYPQIQVPTQQPSTGILWVQGEAGAKAYPVAPGNSVLLMDSESECFYIKSTDVSGMPMPLRVFNYSERKNEPEPKIVPSDYITREEFEERISALMPKKREKKDESTV